MTLTVHEMKLVVAPPLSLHAQRKIRKGNREMINGPVAVKQLPEKRDEDEGILITTVNLLIVVKSQSVSWPHEKRKDWHEKDVYLLLLLLIVLRFIWAQGEPQRKPVSHKVI